MCMRMEERDENDGGKAAADGVERGDGWMDGWEGIGCEMLNAEAARQRESWLRRVRSRRPSPPICIFKKKEKGREGLSAGLHSHTLIKLYVNPICPRFRTQFSQVSHSTRRTSFSHYSRVADLTDTSSVRRSRRVTDAADLASLACRSKLSCLCANRQHAQSQPLELGHEVCSLSRHLRKSSHGWWYKL